MTHPRLVSLQVGRPRGINGGTPWVSAIFKAPVEGPVLLTGAGLPGDEQADLRVHGGPDKAVCVYGVEHLAAWREELGLPEMDVGGFGENFSVAGQGEFDVCIGDRYHVGDALVEVSQPRGPCWKLGRRWQRADLPKRVVRTGRTGWYLRVVREGWVEAGQLLELVERPHPRWTVARVNALTYARPAAPAGAVAELASCEALARDWRLALARRLV